MPSNVWKTFFAVFGWALALTAAYVFNAVQPILISIGATNGIGGSLVIPVFNLGIVLFLMMAAFAAVAFPLSLGWNLLKDRQRTPIYIVR